MSGTAQAPTVGYQGAPGANGERAIAARWGDGARAVPLRTFPMLVAAVADGTVDYGVLPVWNSAIGAVREPSELLGAARGRVEQVGEVAVPVRHALLALRGSDVRRLRAVGSHPAALAQCRGFLSARPEVVPVPAWDTAGAAAELAALAGAGGADADAWHAGVPDAPARTLAVIANAALAARHGLVVLQDDIQDDPRNATRFAVVRARAGGWRW